MISWRVVLPNLFLAALTALLVLCLSDIGQQDIRNYHRLVAISDPSKRLQAPIVASGKQERTNIRKTIIFSEPTGRLRLLMTSEKSELVFAQRGGKMEIVEHLDHISCDMQEELYYTLPDGREVIRQGNGKMLIREADPDEVDSWVDPLVQQLTPHQRVRHIEADSAVYYYASDLLVAERVDLLRYAADGHQLLESFDDSLLLMKGIAKSVQFSFVDKNIHFRAYRIEATLYSGGGLF